MLRPPKVIILTAFKTPGFEAHVRQFGISECYEKPIELDLLNSALRRLVEQQALG